MSTPIEFLALTTEDVNIRVRLFGNGRKWHAARSWRRADQRDAKIMAERTKYQAGIRAVMRFR